MSKYHISCLINTTISIIKETAGECIENLILRKHAATNVIAFLRYLDYY